MKRLIESVPNFSEGRDKAKVDALIQAMSSVPGVYVLDHEMDADHNRCVITLAGEPDLRGTICAGFTVWTSGTGGHHQLHNFWAPPPARQHRNSPAPPNYAIVAGRA